MSRLVLLVVLVLVPRMAAAQSLIELRRVADPSSDTYTFGASNCGDTLVVQWRYNATLALGTLCTNIPLKLWTTASDCAETFVQGSGDVRYADVSTALFSLTPSGTFEVKVADLPAFATGSTLADGGVLGVPCGAAETRNHRVCGVLEVFSFGASCTKQVASSLKLVYDNQPPSAPVITGVTAEDSAAALTYTVSTDTTTVYAEVKGPTATEFSAANEVSATTSFIRVKNLVNTETWTIQLRARDAAGNVSVASAPVDVIPVRTVGFFGIYKDRGGTDQGGCSATGLSLVPLAALALARALSRRSRRP